MGSNPGRGTYALEQDTGWVRLGSLGRPRRAHSGEPLTRANRTITITIMIIRTAYYYNK